MKMKQHKSNKSKDSNCKGCGLYGVCYAIHNIKINSKECPCSICLIKMMCRQRCNEFINFKWYRI